MMNKLRKLFFTSVQAFLYISFIAQIVYIFTKIKQYQEFILLLGVLIAVEWFTLMASRFLFRKASNSQFYNNPVKHNRK